MAIVANMNVWKPRPGRLQDFMAVVHKAKKIHERLGGKVRVWSAQFGGEPFSVGYVTEHSDWKAFGEFAGKLESDAQWQELVAGWTATKDTAADLVQSSVFVEVPVG